MSGLPGSMEHVGTNRDLLGQLRFPGDAAPEAASPEPRTMICSPRSPGTGAAGVYDSESSYGRGSRLNVSKSTVRAVDGMLQAGEFSGVPCSLITRFCISIHPSK